PELGDVVRGVHNLRIRVAAGEHKLHIRWLVANQREDVVDGDQLPRGRDVDLVQNDDVIVPGKHGLAGSLQPSPRFVFVGLARAVHVDESTRAEALHTEVRQVSDRYELAVARVPLHELQGEDA